MKGRPDGPAPTIAFQLVASAGGGHREGIRGGSGVAAVPGRITAVAHRDPCLTVSRVSSKTPPLGVFATAIAGNAAPPSHEVEM
jgi:hypothetical protein